MMSLNNKRASHANLVYNCLLLVYREAMVRLSGYAENLTAALKERYKENSYKSDRWLRSLFEG